MFLLRHLPNTLTICNLLCGCVGIYICDDPNAVRLIPLLIFIACVFDFLDGFAARILNVSSAIGKELDSLADMVTFGVLPALFMVNVLRTEFHTHLAYTALLLAVCSAIRLAKFNVDTRQTDGFIGLATPANALFFSTLPIALDNFGIRLELYPLIAVILLFSWLMVSPIRLFALKFKHFGWKGNELRFTFLAISVLLIGFFQVAGVSLIIITYILASLFDSWRRAGTVQN